MSVKTKKGINYAHDDQIWKDHVVREQTAAKLWPKNWGFLSHEYTKFSFKRSRQSESGVIQKFHTASRESESLKLPPLKPAQEWKGLPFPKTTSCEIGWRSASKSNQLDIYGPYSKPRGSLVKSLNWPPEAIV